MTMKFHTVNTDTCIHFTYVTANKHHIMEECNWQNMMMHMNKCDLNMLICRKEAAVGRTVRRKGKSRFCLCVFLDKTAKKYIHTHTDEPLFHTDLWPPAYLANKISNVHFPF